MDNNDAYRLPGTFLLYTYRIKASYMTKRGNTKERYFEIDGVSEQLASSSFYYAISCHNEKEPHKPFLNVEILSMVEVKRKMIYCNVDGSLSIKSL